MLVKYFICIQVVSVWHLSQLAGASSGVQHGRPDDEGGSDYTEIFSSIQREMNKLNENQISDTKHIADRLEYVTQQLMSTKNYIEHIDQQITNLNNDLKLLIRTIAANAEPSTTKQNVSDQSDRHTSDHVIQNITPEPRRPEVSTKDTANWREPTIENNDVEQGKCKVTPVVPRNNISLRTNTDDGVSALVLPDVDLYVEMNTTRATLRGPVYSAGRLQTENCLYEFEDGEEIVLTCKLNRYYWETQWTDSEGFESALGDRAVDLAVRVMASAAADRLRLTCAAEPAPAGRDRRRRRTVSVLLRRRAPRSVEPREPAAGAGAEATAVYLSVGEQWNTSASLGCNHSRILYPRAVVNGTQTYDVRTLPPRTRTVIQHFRRAHHGATYYCVNYHARVTRGGGDEVKLTRVYERVQDKFVFYLKEDETRTDEGGSDQPVRIDVRRGEGAHTTERN